MSFSKANRRARLARRRKEARRPQKPDQTQPAKPLYAGLLPLAQTIAGPFAKALDEITKSS
jgi:hypothetical protein